MQTIFEYDGNEIAFIIDEGSQMVSATQMAKAAGKDLRDFESKNYYADFVNELRITQSFIEKSGVPYGRTTISLDSDSKNKLDYYIRRASNDMNHGTLYCEELALFYAMRISPSLAVWVMQCFSKMVFGPNALAVKTSIIEIPDSYAKKEGLKSEMKELLKELLPASRVKELKTITKRLRELNGEIERLVNKTPQLDLFDPNENITEEIQNRVIERNKIQSTIEIINKEFEDLKEADPEYQQLNTIFQKHDARYKAAIEVLQKS